MAPPVVVDLFAGAGGFSLGFKLAGFNVVLSIEIASAPAKTYALNFPETIVIQDDIRDYKGSELIKIVEKKPDIVIGSPPCEPFTGANPNRFSYELDRLYQDPKGLLTLEFIRIVGELKPKVFIMENVPSLISSKLLRNAIIYEFNKIEYTKIFFNILKAENYGNPSRRTRVFISNIPLNPPKSKRRVTVIEAIKDLEEFNVRVPNHEPIELSEKKINKISKVKIGDYLTMYKGSSGKNIPLYIRLDPNKLAPTVMGNSRFIHPFKNRFLSVREQARLMSFPDNHVFVGSKDEQYNQVGEAVPVALSYSIAKEVLGVTFGINSSIT